MNAARDAPNTTDAGLRSFSRSLPMALMRAREAVMGEFRPLLAEHGLSEQQWRVLRALTEAAEPMLVGDLATGTNILGPSLSRMLVSLEERALVRRSPVAGDRRRSTVRLTPAGRSLVRRIGPLSEQRYAAIEARFGADRLRMLEDLLAELSQIDGRRSGEGTRQTLGGDSE